jgi:hypothetical protein
MTRIPVWPLLACGLSAFGPAPSMSHAAGPQHDVFERPKPRALKQQESESVKTPKAPPAPIEWKPELRAIIRGGDTAWVNVEGRIVQVGQDMDGFRLINVEERRAVFVKDELRYTLDLREIKAAASASRPGSKAVTGTTSGGSVASAEPPRGSKVASDTASAGEGKAVTDPAAPGSKSVTPPPMGGSEAAADRVPIGSIKASAILPRPEAPRPDPAPSGSGRFAQVSER